MKASAYLSFDGDCEAAFAFYERALGGKIVAMARHAGTPAEARGPRDWREKILHARLETGDVVLMGSDAPPGRYSRPAGFHVSLQVRTPDEADRIYAALAEGATIEMPIQKTFWSLRFGMLVDRFGIPWMVNCDAMAFRELTLTRVFDAPRELVWRAWTDPRHFAKWWGPKGFTAPECRLDVRPGGKIEAVMSGPPPFEHHPMGGEFVEVKSPERLVFITRAFPDESGNWALEGTNTVTFEDVGGKTRLTLHAVITKAGAAQAPAISGMETGWSQSLDKLAALLTAH